MYIAVRFDVEAAAAERWSDGLLEADRRKWDYHPLVTDFRHARQGQYYKVSPTRDFAGVLELMKQYVVSRGGWVDRNVAEDTRIPATPTATYIGEAEHPAAGLRFKASEYVGQAEFAGVKWRIAEVGDRAPADSRQGAAYEIKAAWESGELPTMGEVTIPAKGIEAGRTYRVRVRMKDKTGRWSHWSAPVEFTAGAK